MKTSNLLWIAVAIVLAVGPAFAQAPEPMIELPDHVSHHLDLLEPSVPAQPEQVLSMMILFSVQNHEAAEKYLQDLADPSSPNYQHFLQGHEFAQRFGVTAGQFQAVADWLTQKGFQITGGSQTDGFVRFTGTVQEAENAFGVNIIASADGRNFSNTNNPQIPARFAGLFGYIMGFTTLVKIQPALKRAPSATPRPDAPHATLHRPSRTPRYAQLQGVASDFAKALGLRLPAAQPVITL